MNIEKDSELQLLQKIIDLAFEIPAPNMVTPQIVTIAQSLQCMARAAKVGDADRIKLLQYQSLRDNFHNMVGDVLGKDYYNMGMDVYECDRICCEDITRKANLSWFGKLINQISAMLNKEEG